MSSRGFDVPRSGTRFDHIIMLQMLSETAERLAEREIVAGPLIRTGGFFDSCVETKYRLTVL